MLRGGERRHWTEQDTAVLKAIVDQNPGLYLDEIMSQLEARTKARWSSSTIWKKLRQELGYSLQRVAEKALEQDNEERLLYQIALEAAVDHPEQLVYIDESQKGRNAARRNRWWSKRGRTPQRSTRFDFEVKRQYTLIAACDVNGFIHEACDIVLRGNNAQQEIDNPLIGTVGTERVELWVEQCLVRILGNYSRGEPRSIVVMDNATVHHSQKIQDLITNAGALLLYLAPYSPDKNPIELMFGQYKLKLKAYELNPDWHNTHLWALHSVNPSMARAFFRHCGVPGCDTIINQEEQEVQKRKRKFVVVAAAVAAAIFIKRQRGEESSSLKK